MSFLFWPFMSAPPRRAYTARMTRASYKASREKPDCPDNPSGFLKVRGKHQVSPLQNQSASLVPLLELDGQKLD